MQKKKIIYLIPNLGIGGPQRLVLDIENKINNELFDVYIISLTSSNFLVNKESDRIINLFFCDVPQQKKMRYVNFGSLRKLYNFIKIIKPDIIHSHLWGTTCLYIIFLYPFILRMKIQYFHTIHSSGGYFKDKGLGNLISLKSELGFIRLFKAVTIVISKEINQLAEESFKLKRCVYLPNGIDFIKFNKLYDINKEYYGYCKNDIIIIYQARGQESKGHRIALNAISLLLSEHENLKLLFVGSGVNDLIRDEILRLKLEKYVNCIGPRHDIAELLSVSDIGIFPSYYEGLPIALGEMMSCKLPVVASNIPSICEISLNGKGCLLAQTGSADDFAAKIKMLLHSEEFRGKLGQTARKIIVENFSINKTIQSHEELYLKHNLN
jgi:glycosyltransferase involved in cell wall biosynthesis